MAECPSREVLTQLLAEALSGPDLALIREHVQNCTGCQTLLDELTDEAELRQWAPGHRLATTLNQEPGLARVLRQAQRQPGPGAGSQPGLAPPQRPGDLGSLGAYALEAELGRGGMGIVYRATDLRLQRTVAVKIMRPDLIASVDQQRFLRESRAAARVTHDHVVRVYASHDAEGTAPHLVMEYLEGPTLAARLRHSPRLEVRDVAAIIAQAAQGLEAVHAAGLVHRDIKPSNIMLDQATGRAKLMDFGLARSAEGASVLSSDGCLAGTPVYMSPEQALGQTNLDARSDIYSLGATFYEALTGETPFRGAPHLVLNQIVTEEPIAPRRLQDGIPLDLETICLKCLDKDPRGRYPRAAELAEDLRRFLAGEPILARRAGRGERLLKWARRRPAVAGLVAVSILGTLLLLAGTLRYNYELQLHNAALAAAANRERGARRRSDSNYEKARQAVRDLLSEVGRRHLADVPGMALIRRTLLEKALAYRQSFLTDEGADAPALLERMEAGADIAEIYRLLGQNDQAIAACRQALATAAAWQEKQELAPRERQQKALLEMDLGTLELDASHALEAETSLASAERELRQLATSWPTSLEYRRDHARALVNWGMLLGRTTRDPQAEAAFRSAIAIYEALVAENPGDPLLGRRLAGAQNNLAVCLRSQHRYPEAIVAYRDAQKLYDELLEASPNAVDFREELGITCNNLGSLLWDQGEHSAAAQAYQRGLDLREQLVKDFPRVPEYLHELALSCENVGLALPETDKTPERARHDRELVERALALKRSLLAEYPQAPRYKASLGQSLGYLAERHVQARRWAEARPMLEEAIRLEKEALEPNPRNQYFRRLLRAAYEMQTTVLLGIQDLAAAVEAASAGAEVFPDRGEDALTAAKRILQCLQQLPTTGSVAKSDRSRLERQWTAKVIELLRRALAQGAVQPAQLRSAADFAILRGQPKFESILQGHPPK